MSALHLLGFKNYSGDEMTLSYSGTVSGSYPLSNLETTRLDQYTQFDDVGTLTATKATSGTLPVQIIALLNCYSPPTVASKGLTVRLRDAAGVTVKEWEHVPWTPDSGQQPDLGCPHNLLWCLDAPIEARFVDVLMDGTDWNKLGRLWVSSALDLSQYLRRGWGREMTDPSNVQRELGHDFRTHERRRWRRKSFQLHLVPEALALGLSADWEQSLYYAALVAGITDEIVLIQRGIVDVDELVPADLQAHHAMHELSMYGRLASPLRFRMQGKAEASLERIYSCPLDIEEAPLGFG